MRVYITNVEETGHGSGCHVNFIGLAGHGCAEWVGQLPNLGDEHEAELDTEEVFELSRNCTVAENTEPVLDCSSGEMFVRGVVEQIFEDGMVSLRIGDDAVILLEFTGTLPTEGEWLEMRSNRWQLFPANV